MLITVGQLIIKKKLSQDNVQLAVNILSPHLPFLGWFTSVRWATVMHFLLALLALPFSVLWDQVG